MEDRRRLRSGSPRWRRRRGRRISRWPAVGAELSPARDPELSERSSGAPPSSRIFFHSRSAGPPSSCNKVSVSVAVSVKVKVEMKRTKIKAKVDEGGTDHGHLREGALDPVGHGGSAGSHVSVGRLVEVVHGPTHAHARTHIEASQCKAQRKRSVAYLE